MTFELVWLARSWRRNGLICTTVFSVWHREFQVGWATVGARVIVAGLGRSCFAVIGVPYRLV